MQTTSKEDGAILDEARYLPKSAVTEICLLGASLETDNRGVSALAAGASKLIAEALDSAHITILQFARNAPDHRFVWGPHGQMRIDMVSYRRSPAGGLSHNIVFALACAVLVRIVPLARIRDAIVDRIPLLRALREAELVADVFGGDSLTDSYGLFRLASLCMPRWCALLMRKPYVLLPQTYGPFESRLGRRLAGSLIGRASLLFTRSAQDDVLNRWDGSLACIPRYCPDMAFALDADPSCAAMVRRDVSADQLVVGVNVSGLLYRGGYTRQNMFGLKVDYPKFVINLVLALGALGSVKVVLIPHTYNVTNLCEVENDLGACRDVADRVRSEGMTVNVVDESLDQHQIKGAIGGCDFFVGSRLHSCIAALSQGVVAVGLAYSKKFSELYSTLGVDCLVVDARRASTEDAFTQTLERFYNREQYAAHLQVALVHQRAAIQESMRLIRRLSDQGEPS